jgi:hypothetical protein
MRRICYILAGVVAVIWFFPVLFYVVLLPGEPMVKIGMGLLAWLAPVALLIAIGVSAKK